METVPIDTYKPYQSPDSRKLVLQELCAEYGMQNVLDALKARCTSFAQRNKAICATDAANLSEYMTSFTTEALNPQNVANIAIDAVDTVLEIPALAPQAQAVLQTHFGVDDVQQQKTRPIWGILCIAFLLLMYVERKPNPGTDLILRPLSDQPTMTTDVTVRPQVEQSTTTTTTDLMVRPRSQQPTTSTDVIVRPFNMYAVQNVLQTAFNASQAIATIDAGGQTVLKMQTPNQVALYKKTLPQLILKASATNVFTTMLQLSEMVTRNKNIVQLFNNMYTKDEKQANVIQEYAANLWTTIKERSVKLALQTANDVTLNMKRVIALSYTHVIDVAATTASLAQGTIAELGEVMASTAWDIYNTQAPKISQFMLQKTNDANQVAVEAIKSGVIYLYLIMSAAVVTPTFNDTDAPAPALNTTTTKRLRDEDDEDEEDAPAKRPTLRTTTASATTPASSTTATSTTTTTTTDTLTTTTATPTDNSAYQQVVPDPNIFPDVIETKTEKAAETPATSKGALFNMVRSLDLFLQNPFGL